MACLFHSRSGFILICIKATVKSGGGNGKVQACIFEPVPFFMLMRRFISLNGNVVSEDDCYNRGRTAILTEESTTTFRKLLPPILLGVVHSDGKFAIEGQ